MSLSIVIACGGTGGHLFPGIAVAEELQRRGHSVVALISEKNIDALAAEKYQNLTFRTVPAVAMPRVYSPAMLKFIVRLWKTVGTCRGIIGETGADAVLGMGGFTSLPPVFAGRRMKKKTFIHESNAVPGKANRLTARFCDVVLLGLDDCAAHFPSRPTEVVGTPVRADLKPGGDRAAARRHFGLEPGRGTVLVMGGSQGARGLNRAVCRSLDAIGAAGLQVLHFSGTTDHEEVAEAYRGVSFPHHVAAFCSEMGTAYQAADLALARSGASSLAELAAFRLPSVLVPFPFAADDHQKRNAEIAARGGAAVLAEEDGLGGDRLGTVVTELFGTEGRLDEMARKSGEMAHAGASRRIADVIEQTCARG